MEVVSMKMVIIVSLFVLSDNEGNLPLQIYNPYLKLYSFLLGGGLVWYMISAF